MGFPMVMRVNRSKFLEYLSPQQATENVLHVEFNHQTGICQINRGMRQAQRHIGNSWQRLRQEVKVFQVYPFNPVITIPLMK